jgi:hypothetical protein
LKLLTEGKERAVADPDDQGNLLSGLKLPRTTARILKFAYEIQDTKPERPDYLHSVLCQVGLPRSETKSLTFERANGSASLLIEAGKLWNGSAWVQQPLPCGTRPRLALVHVSSEAVRSQSAVVDLGGSVREFLIRLGVDTGGREYATFAHQMRALSACRMSLGFGTETIDAKPIERFNAWTDADGERQLGSPGVIELTPKFFASLTEFAVPLDSRALAALKHSALALDVYTWLAHRLLRVKRVTGERVTWKNLRDQFGQEYADPKNFKRKMVATLRSVLAVYPDARIEPVLGGLILLPSKPPVPKITQQVKAIEK